MSWTRLNLLRAILVTGVLCGPAVPLSAGERDLRPPRVPSDQLQAAKTLGNPLSDSFETRQRGQELYEGKGACVNCHGRTGGGDGPVAGALDPSPRNFHRPDFWRQRSDGEIFWVIKHGSPGTSMVSFSDQLTDEEIWAVLRYLHNLSTQTLE